MTDPLQPQFTEVLTLIKTAQQKVIAIANVSGSRLGTIRKAETDVFQITARYSTEVSNNGSYSTTSIDKDIQ
jgi:hypothetical protein